VRKILSLRAAVFQNNASSNTGMFKKRKLFQKVLFLSVLAEHKTCYKNLALPPPLV